MLVFGIQDAFKAIEKAADQERFIGALASDENLLQQLEDTYMQVFNKLKQKYGESNILNTQGGMWNLQTNSQPRFY